MNADRSARDLAAVEHEVVPSRQARARIGVEDPELVGIRARERVVQRDPPLAVVVPLEHREVDDPEEVPLALGHDLEVARDLLAELAERLRRDVVVVGREHDDVARLKAERGRELRAHRLEELRDARLERVRAELGVGDAAGLEGLRELAVAVEHLAGELLVRRGDADRLHDALAAGLLLRERVLEDGELGLGGDRRHIAGFEPVARVGAVDAEALHRFPVRHARHFADVVVEELLPETARESGHHAHHILALDEAHLEVDLRELGLAVGARVFVAHALADLHVAVAARDHQDLLEELRALRKRVPLARVQARRHDEVARALGRRLDEERRLDLEEAVLAEVVAGELGDARTRVQDLLHARAAEVDVAVLEARLLADLVRLAVVGKDRRRLRRVEELELLGDEFDLAGREVRVRAARADADLAGHGDHILAAQRARQADEVGGGLLEVEDDLAEALAVAEVGEDQTPTLVAVGVDPTRERDRLSDMARPQGATHVRALEHKGRDGTRCGGARGARNR